MLSWLLDDGGQLLTELWKAVSWFRDADHFSVSAQICRLLFPRGASGPSNDGKLGSNPEISLKRNWRHSVLSSGDVGRPDQTEPEPEAAARSLQALVSYHQLYRLWWRHSADGSSQDKVEDKLPNGSADEPCGTPGPAALDFDVLLSEQHAVYQAAQKTVREVQEKLSTMVLQHNRGRGSQPDPAEGESDTEEVPATQRCADAGEEEITALFLPLQLSRSLVSVCRPDQQDTLLSLSHKMSKHQKELEDASETLKVRPNISVHHAAVRPAFSSSPPEPNSQSVGVPPDPLLVQSLS